MTVYVDQPRWRLGRMHMCHMMADTEEELHEMAERLGLKREWFQPHATLAHYDICKSKRALALRLGAVEEDTKACIRRLKRSDEAPQVEHLRRHPPHRQWNRAG